VTRIEHTRPLQLLRHSDEPRFGGKSTGLGELIAGGISVPPGFGVSTDAFEEFVTDAGLRQTIERAIASIEDGNIDSLEAASSTIGEAMHLAPVSDDVVAAVTRSYAELADAVGEAEPAVAVRSSARGEDSEDATFAGQQDTFLWVRGAREICDKLRSCWMSLYSPPAISYRARLEPDRRGASMGVAVQLMVDAVTAGVMFTCNPISGDPSVVAVNASWGLGLAVVGGEVTPDDYLVSKVTGEVVREQLARKNIQYVVDPTGRGAVAVQVAEDLREERCLGSDELAALLAVARRVEGYFGSHQDIEWAIARGGDGAERLFVVQSRPVTGLSHGAEPAQPLSAMALVMGTFGAAPKPQGG